MLEDCPENRKLSFSQEADHEQTNNFGMATMLMHTDAIPNATCDDIDAMASGNGNATIIAPTEAPIVVDNKPELTCISEEGIADIEYPYADCVTPCDKVN